jgi:hypothetical protein
MAGFEGWWINSRTGQGHHVAEHWMEVKSDPERYGLSEDQVEKILAAAGGKFNPGDTSPDGARGMLLKAAMQNDWVRVRGYQGKYAIQVYGHLASRLPKVMQFLRKAGVGPYSEILLTDLSTDYFQKFVDGMGDIHKALKQGKIPDSEPKPTTKDVIKGVGFPADSSDKDKRVTMRQRLGQKTHIPDPDVSDDKIEERKSLAKGLAKLLG